MGDSYNTGLGPEVDRLVEFSATLKQMFQEARKRFQDFKIKLADKTYCSGHTVGIARSCSPIERTVFLAHELAHVLEDQGPIPLGRTFEQWVEINVADRIAKQAAADKLQFQVLDEIVHRAGLAGFRVGNSDKFDMRSKRLLDEGRETEFMERVRRSPSSVSEGESCEEYWRRNFQGQRHVYEGLKSTFQAMCDLSMRPKEPPPLARDLLNPNKIQFDIDSFMDRDPFDVDRNGIPDYLDNDPFDPFR